MRQDFNKRVDFLSDRLNEKYWTSERTTYFINGIREQEQKTINQRLTAITDTQQDQIDDIYYEHLAVPGIINPMKSLEDPLDLIYSEDLSLDGSSSKNSAEDENSPPKAWQLEI